MITLCCLYKQQLPTDMILIGTDLCEENMDTTDLSASRSLGDEKSKWDMRYPCSEISCGTTLYELLAASPPSKSIETEGRNVVVIIIIVGDIKSVPIYSRESGGRGERARAWVQRPKQLRELERDGIDELGEL